MKRCVLMFGILVIVIVIASILENEYREKVIKPELAMEGQRLKSVINTKK